MILNRFEKCIEIARKRQYEKELIKEWNETFPCVSDYELNAIFDYYGFISPIEFIISLKKEFEQREKSIEQIKILLKHLKILLWDYINRSKKKKNIREILREQIKVIDDEELIFAF